jgi:hypothetical protein
VAAIRAIRVPSTVTRGFALSASRRRDLVIREIRVSSIRDPSAQSASRRFVTRIPRNPRLVDS